MNATAQYPIHPLAAAFPEMAQEEFEDLKKSIQDHGLRHKIVLIEHEGGPHVLDGRNRYKACLELGIPPIFRDFDPMTDGDLPVSFVADENLNRRNLTTSQRAAIAAELEPFFAAALAAEKARKAAEQKAKKDAKKAQAETPAAAAPAPATGTAPDWSGDAEEELRIIHKLEKGSSVLKGVVAAAKGEGLDANPFDEGHPARDLWKRGWEQETARAIQTNVEDDDLEIGTKQPADAAGSTTAAPAGETSEEEPAATVVDGTKTEGETSEPAAAEPTTAAGQAAAATGVGERTVRDAKDLKEKAPEEFEKVKSGEKTLNQAKQDAKALGESISPYRAECADLLEAGMGEEFAQALRDVTVLKTTAELEAFMKLTVPHQKEVIPFVVKGWKVADAIKFLRGEFDNGTTAGELISYANAKGGTAAVEIGNFTITIEKSK